MQVESKVDVQNESGEENSTQPNSLLDKVGVWLTSLCALHCLITPLLLPVLPLLASSFVAEHWFERLILTFSILVGFAALFIGFHKHHRKIYPIYSLVLGGLLYWNKEIFGHDFEPVVVTLGAIFIVVAHIANIRLCRQCNKCEHA